MLGTMAEGGSGKAGTQPAVPVGAALSRKVGVKEQPLGPLRNGFHTWIPLLEGPRPAGADRPEHPMEGRGTGVGARLRVPERGHRVRVGDEPGVRVGRLQHQVNPARRGQPQQAVAGSNHPGTVGLSRAVQGPVDHRHPGGDSQFLGGSRRQPADLGRGRVHPGKRLGRQPQRLQQRPGPSSGMGIEEHGGKGGGGIGRPPAREPARQVILGKSHPADLGPHLPFLPSNPQELGQGPGGRDAVMGQPEDFLAPLRLQLLHLLQGALVIPQDGVSQGIAAGVQQHRNVGGAGQGNTSDPLGRNRAFRQKLTGGLGCCRHPVLGILLGPAGTRGEGGKAGAARPHVPAGSVDRAHLAGGGAQIDPQQVGRVAGLDFVGAHRSSVFGRIIGDREAGRMLWNRLSPLSGDPPDPRAGTPGLAGPRVVRSGLPVRL